MSRQQLLKCKALAVVQTIAVHVQMFADAGLEMPGFTGVPIFQAEGLTVKTNNQRYTPIFLAKADLDAAVKNAFGQRVRQKAQVENAKIQRARRELEDAKQQVLLLLKLL